jgi:uncharacterized protein YdiU (UPF0061 family)
MLKTSSYLSLGDKFYSFEKPTIDSKILKSVSNQELSDFLNIRSVDDFNKIFSGKKFAQNNQEIQNTISLCYAGHQFGHFVNQLGDGRAIILGELTAKNNVDYDIQIKGSGRTKFSRRGDGFLTLEAAIREFLVSESLHCLNIETTRSLAFFVLDEKIYREDLTSRAILTRVAKSHIRIGTFEYFYYRNDVKSIKKLADYCINRYYPTIQNDGEKYQNFFLAVVKKQAHLVAKWISLGFVHGVMNTDNTSISGETIDFGPRAFIDEFSFNKVFSSIDYQGRYAFFNQVNIIKWNLFSLANCLKFLFSEDEKNADNIMQNLISEFDDCFNQFWESEMANKIGFEASFAGFEKIIRDLLELMQQNQVDYTLFFSELTNFLISKKEEKIMNLFNKSNDFINWFENWKNLISKNSKEKTFQLMNKKNPKIIARNHLVKKAIDEILLHDNYDFFNKFFEILKNPFLDLPTNSCDLKDFEIFTLPPKSHEKVYQTFCGT